MCLTLEWFEEAESRKEKRNNEGVSFSEAADCLAMYHSTVYPIGREMAEWLYNNWSLSEIDKLPAHARGAFFEIIQEFQKRNMGINDPI